MGRYLSDCLYSILDQQYNNIEIIIIDGGSNDNTFSVVEKYKEYITTFISEPDKGQGDAVTKGLKLATGDICHWHAADDIVMPDAFKLVTYEFLNDPSLNLVISNGYAFDENKLVITGKCRWINYETTLFHFGRFQSDCSYWRSHLTSKALPLDITKPLMVDEDFFLRLWDGNKHKWLNMPLGAFRMHGAQVSQRVNRDSLALDRQATRNRIFTEKGFSKSYITFMRGKTLLPYILYHVLLPCLDDIFRKFLRFITRDQARKQLFAKIKHRLERSF